MEASYDTELLRQLAAELADVADIAGTDLGTRMEALRLESVVWPGLGMAETPGQYDLLWDTFRQATQAMLDMTGTLSESLRAIADEYARQEEQYGSDIESLVE